MPTVHKIRVDNRIYTVQTDGPEPPTEAEMDAALGTSSQAGTVSAGPAEPETNWAREAAIAAASGAAYTGGALIPGIGPIAGPAASGLTDFGLRALLGEKGEAQRSILPNLANMLTRPAAKMLPPGALEKAPQLANTAVQSFLSLLGYGGNVAAGQEEYSDIGAGVSAGIPAVPYALSKPITGTVRGLTKILAPSAVRLARGEEARSGGASKKGILYEALSKLIRDPSADDFYANIRAQGAGQTEDMVQTRATQKLLGSQESMLLKYAPGFGSPAVGRVSQVPETPVLPQGTPSQSGLVTPGGAPVMTPPTPQQIQDYYDLLDIAEGKDMPFESLWRLKTRTNERLKTAQNPLNPDYETIGVMKKVRSSIQEDIDSSNLSPRLKEADKRYAREASLDEVKEAVKKRWTTEDGVKTFDAKGILEDFVQMRYIIDQKTRIVPGQTVTAAGRLLAGRKVSTLGEADDKFFAAGFDKGELDDLEKYFTDLAHIIGASSPTGMAVKASVATGFMAGAAAALTGSPLMGAGGIGIGAASTIGYALPGMFYNIATAGPKARRMFLAAARAGKGRFTEEAIMAISQLAEQERASLGAFGTTGKGKEFTVEVSQPDEPGKEDWEEVR